MTDTNTVVGTGAFIIVTEVNKYCTNREGRGDTYRLETGGDIMINVNMISTIELHTDPSNYSHLRLINGNAYLLKELPFEIFSMLPSTMRIG